MTRTHTPTHTPTRDHAAHWPQYDIRHTAIEGYTYDWHTNTAGSDRLAGHAPGHALLTVPPSVHAVGTLYCHPLAPAHANDEPMALPYTPLQRFGLVCLGVLCSWAAVLVGVRFVEWIVTL